MTFALSWLVCLELACGYPYVSGGLALMVLLCTPFSRWILNDREDDRHTQIPSINWTTHLSTLVDVSLASLSKALIYTSRNKAKE